MKPLYTLSVFQGLNWNVLLFSLKQSICLGSARCKFKRVAGEINPAGWKGKTIYLLR